MKVYQLLADPYYRLAMGENMTTTTLEVGDIVRVVPDEAEVTYDNGDGRLDLKYVVGGAHVEYVPAGKLVLVRKRPVPEPPVGTVIKYISAFPFDGSNDWVRTEKGWLLFEKGVASGYSPCKWSDFANARVRLYQAATTPPK